MTCWGIIGGGDKDGERVGKKEQKEYLGGRTMDCSIGGGRMTGVRIGM
jgi:hypothetical protein